MMRRDDSLPSSAVDDALRDMPTAAPRAADDHPASVPDRQRTVSRARWEAVDEPPSTAMQQQLAEILDEYLRGVEAGQPADPVEFAARYPELGDALREGLEGLALLQEGIGEFRPGSILGDHEGLDATKQPLLRQLGDYELIRELGRGGMGVVYEARQVSLDRKVALKVLPFAAMLDRTQVVRFQNEARAAAQLQHPHIVPIHAVGVDRGVHYYAMQFIEGQSLARAIDELRDWQLGEAETKSQTGNASTKSMRPATSASREPRRGLLSFASPAQTGFIEAIVRLTIQAADALHAAHEWGVVHRDVKPSNLMLDERQELWVTDFGLARSQFNAQLTRTGDVVGTLYYMSPEQAKGDSTLVDRRTDVYSLGVTLYELLTWRRAFSAPDDARVLEAIQHGEFAPPRRINPAIPTDLENVVLKAMATAPEDRYRTARDLADDLQRFLDGLPTQAKRPSWSKRTTRWLRRHQRWVAVGAGVAALALVGLFVGTLLVVQESSRTQQALQDLGQAKEAVHQVGARAVHLLAGTPGAEYVRAELLRNMLDYSQRFLEQAAHSPAMALDVAGTHAEIASIYQQLGQTEPALEEYRTAQRLCADLLAVDTTRSEPRRLAARCRNNAGLLLRELGRLDEAEGEFQALLDAARSQPLPMGDIEGRIDLALAWNNLGLVRVDRGATAQALQCYQTAAQSLETLVDATKQFQPRVLSSLAMVYTNLSQRDRSQPLTESIRWATRGVELQRKLVQNAAPAQAYQADLATACNNLASLYAQLQDHARAIEFYEEASRWQENLRQVEPFIANHRRDLAVTLNNLGLAHCNAEQDTAAEQVFMRALKLQQDLVKEFPADLLHASRLGGLQNNLAMVYQRRERWDQAVQWLEQGVRYQRYALDGAPDSKSFRDNLSRNYYNYAQALRQLRRPAEAIEVIRRRRDLWPSHPEQLYTIAKELTQVWLLVRELDTNPANGKTGPYVQEVLTTLEQARAAGWQPAPASSPDLVQQTFGSDPRFAPFWKTGTFKIDSGA